MKKRLLTILMVALTLSGLVVGVGPVSAAARPSPPRSVNIRAVTVNNGIPVVQVTWSNVSGATGYDVYRAEGGGYGVADRVQYVGTVRGGTTFNDVRHPLKKQYTFVTYRVVAFNDRNSGRDKYSEKSVVANGSLRAFKPGNASVWNANKQSGGRIKVNFQRSQHAHGYNVYRNGKFLKSIGANQSMIDNPPRGRHTYTMTAYAYKGYYFTNLRGSATITK